MIRNGRDHKDVRTYSKYLIVFSFTMFLMTDMILVPVTFLNTFSFFFLFYFSLSYPSCYWNTFCFFVSILFYYKSLTPILLLNRTYTLYLHIVLTHIVRTHLKVYVLTIIAGKYEANKSGKSVRGEDVFVWSTPVINSLCRNISTHRLLPGRCHR